ncbi:MAG: hypothetical protein KC474_01155 [Cyanobacteria bacterium HKST-UBA04]|nr:hypothetical protein [Cyanobacteria bacterium HKST-UBA04]
MITDQDQHDQGNAPDYKEILSVSLKNSGLDTGAKRKRWYTQYKHICLLLDVIQYLPENIQGKIGDGFGNFVKAASDRMTSGQELKNVGPDKVKGLYLSQQKRRWSDRIPELHYGLKMLATLPEELVLICDTMCVDVITQINTLLDQKRNIDGQNPAVYVKIAHYLDSSDSPFNNCDTYINHFLR